MKQELNHQRKLVWLIEKNDCKHIGISEINKILQAINISNENTTKMSIVP